MLRWMRWLLPAAALTVSQVHADPVVSLARGDQDRITVQVYLNGSGPYAFLVDTAATHSVVSQRLAAKLGLVDRGAAQVRDAQGVAQVRLARVDQLQVGGRIVSDLVVPVLREEDVGADGILGLDTFADQRVSIDAKHNQIVIAAAGHPVVNDPQAIVRQFAADRRAGQMFISDADIDGIPVTVVVDSGASTSVINQRMARMLRTRGRPIAGLRATLISATGKEQAVGAVKLDRIRVGDLMLMNAPVAIADLDVFAALGLSDRPTILLGMNLLGSFDRIDLDFQRRRVSFIVHPDGIQVPLQASYTLARDFPFRPTAPLIGQLPAAPTPTK